MTCTKKSEVQILALLVKNINHHKPETSSCLPDFRTHVLSPLKDAHRLPCLYLEL